MEALSRPEHSFYRVQVLPHHESLLGREGTWIFSLNLLCRSTVRNGALLGKRGWCVQRQDWKGEFQCASHSGYQMTISGEIQRPWTRHYDFRDLVKFCSLGYFHVVVSLSPLYNVPVVIKKTKKQTKAPYTT